ncbi:type III pantothenate kinase [Candidatus Nitrospira nitrificans]|uniref:Type III pantothenate kinase n=1 Tax=Candidatus Nitrospira nitrificans TaxID=1742973 RepID=A0A0S4LSQ0_9BACT|nr:type III pantothenate kinase [Candidatus Nitrospira nitrificans]CUS38934.1 Type III pantothenate kinase [Candidatus Nitrospira nitrificans]
MGSMLLAVDIGNTNVVAGIFEGSVLLTHWRLATDPKTTADEYGVLCLSLMARDGRLPEHITGAIISSVVPALTETFESMIETSFGSTPITVSSDMDTGLTLKYSNPKEIGSDRIVNAAAAYEKFHRDLIIVDFGTATTFCAVNRDGEYLGGVIAPGLTISAEALFSRAAKLSKVELARPKTVIGTDTAGSIQSGLIFGYAGLVDTLVQRMERELGRTSYVVATGGLASVIAPEARSIQHLEPLLTLHGLELLYRRARGASLTQWV